MCATSNVGALLICRVLVMQIESGRVLNQLAGKIKAVQKEIDQVSYRTVPYRCWVSMGIKWSEGYLYFQNVR